MVFEREELRNKQGRFWKKEIEMNNPYAMHMIVKQRQSEARKKADLYRGIRDTEKDTGTRSREEFYGTSWSWTLPASFLGFLIMMFLI
jgi:hypothetical protein